MPRCRLFRSDIEDCVILSVLQALSNFLCSSPWSSIHIWLLPHSHMLDSLHPSFQTVRSRGTKVVYRQYCVLKNKIKAFRTPTQKLPFLLHWPEILHGHLQLQGRLRNSILHLATYCLNQTHAVSAQVENRHRVGNQRHLSQQTEGHNFRHCICPTR